jgi:Ca-activated chloride channel homolog
MNNPSSDIERSSKTMNTVIVVVLVLLGLTILAGLLLPSLAKAKARAASRGPRLHSLYAEADLPIGAPSPVAFNTEAYAHIIDNPFLDAKENPLSTFSIDVDTASYSNVRRFLNRGQLPPKDAVRIEELLNYFRYRYAGPTDDHPFAAHVEIADCPWQPAHRLVRIGLKGKEIAPAERPPCNLVFLIDVSGSMEDPNKLPLVQTALELLLAELTPNDRVAIVVYAGNSGLVLDSTSCKDKRTIRRAIERLRAGGSTNGGAGIQLAYDTATKYFIKGGVNRVILCTDGDFNVGITSGGDLTRLIQQKARTGVFLTVLGFGMGNYKDSTLEQLADLGNGNYGYIDALPEAKRLLVEQLNSTLVTIAKDVKIQVEFNPQKVGAYRLIGYENRLLRKEDFNDDKKDAGEIGSGHVVTAFYEIVPASLCAAPTGVDPLKYQNAGTFEPSPELLTIKLRYKQPDGDASQLMTLPVIDEGLKLREASSEFKFAAAVASFGMLLRDSEHKGSSHFDLVSSLATEGQDGSEYRQEFLELVASTRSIDKRERRR